MDTKNFVQEFLPGIKSTEDVYRLFRGLGYPEDKVLDPTYKRKIGEFELAKEEREKVENIYTVFNYDGKIQIFLIETKTLSSHLVRYITKRFSDRYLRFLLILTCDYKEYTFVFPGFERIEAGRHKPKMTRLVFDTEYLYHTDFLTLSNLALTGKEENWRGIWLRWRDAFSVRKVTSKFFDGYKNAFFDLRDTFEEAQGIKIKEAHELAQQFLNRLMFLYFIAKKKWLSDDAKFIRWFWNRYRQERKHGNAKDNTFYENWLRILFLEAFNNRYSHPGYHPGDVKSILANAPYLNGGLFHRNALDDLPFYIDDELFEKVFNFFEQYNFTIHEAHPLDVEVAVDPKMIGYVYESLSNVAEEIYERQDLGIFYTPIIEVEFMCKRTVVEYLANHLQETPKEWIYRLLFDEDKKEVEKYIAENNLWYRLEELFDNLSVIDPACGSGAFLVGMLHVLLDLYRLTYSHIKRDMTEFELKKKIIGNSLYGVDVMPWAVHSAELRLWLQLIIEENIPFAQRKLHPLLPNLNMRLRAGDSMVQEVGGINLHLRDGGLSPSLKRKLTSLKTEKEKYYNNDPTAKFKNDKLILQEELRIFCEVIDERIFTLQNKKQVNDYKTQYNLYDAEKNRQAEAESSKKKEKVEKEIEALVNIKRTIQAPGRKPFIWDIDFAEIFGDKGGFDIVIGNPPYVRQEKIAPPNKLKKDVTVAEKKQYKEKLLRSIQAHLPFIRKMDKKSDYYVYFYFHGLSLLNSKGSFCFITSNSWLDVGYGKDLQEFLLRYCHIKAIYDNQTRRSFEHADVNTVIALLGSPVVEKGRRRAPSEWPALTETARFVMFKVDFEKVVNTRNLIEIEKADTVLKTNNYRVYPVKQETLLEEGWEYPEDTGEDQKKAFGFNIGKYASNKWGGKYLRAPDIYFTILEKGKGKLVRLGDVAEVRRGFTTGCNEFFYLPSKHFDIRKEGQYYDLLPKHEGLPKGIRIEEEYLPFSVLSPRNLDSIYIKPSNLKKHLLLLDSRFHPSNGIEAYIKWGEQQKFNIRPSCMSRDKWWAIAGRSKCLLACNYLVNDYMRFYYSRKGTWFSDNFQEINKSGNHIILSILLNSIVSQLFLNMTGRSNFGGGLLKIQTYEVSDLLTIDPLLVSVDVKELENVLINFNQECNLPIYEQCGLNPNLPIREQNPTPLPDRKALDDIVFDILGLTQDERNEVYWAVCELIKNRLEKAKSLKV